MGCFYKAANQTSCKNETFATLKITNRTRTSNLVAEKVKQNCKYNQQQIVKYSTNDDCQLKLQQKLQTTKAKKTSAASVTIGKVFYKDNTNNKVELKNKFHFHNLEPKGHLNKATLSASCFSAAPPETINLDIAEDINGRVLQEYCLNCYPLACHNRVGCKQLQQQHQQQSHLAIANNSKESSCSHNNYCRCHLSIFYPKHRNTLQNEQPNEQIVCHCNCFGTKSKDFATFANNYTVSGHCLQKTLAHARASLASNVLDLKNNLVEVLGNCATIVGSLMGTKAQCMKHSLNNGSNINHNKSEPYRGYCQRIQQQQQQQQQHNKINNEPNFTSYTTSYISTLASNFSSISCSLHDAISSNSRCNNTNNKSSSSSGRRSDGCNKRNSTRTCNNNYNSSASSAHTAAFNYIGHNYYHFLRNSINFYTASSVILVLCYLTTTTSAATTKSDTTSMDKHPIQGIDWSKFDESSSDKEILDLLLEKKRYDKRLLPPVNDEDFCCGLSSPEMATEQNSRRPHNRGTLTVNVNVLLLSLASPDESSLKYEVEFLLNQQWNDPRLQYGNKSHYDFLNALHHHDSIWTPDTYFIMHGDFKDPIIPMHFALRIYRNGTITYAMRRHLILSCQGSLHIFPFDDPKCSFSMESISYEEAQIKYVWKNDEDTLRKSPSLTTLNAYLIKNQTTPCDQNSWRGNYSCLRVDLIFTRDRAFYFTTVFIPGIILVTSSFITFWLEWNAVPARSMIGNYSCLQVELTFTRDRAYYFTTVFIPGIILVTSSFITFWLEWNAVPARVMIGVTTMLNFFTTSNGFRSTLPVVSNLTAMNVWDGVCMCFIYASLLEFVCVNYMGRKRPQHNVVYRPGENPVTQRLPAVLSRIGVILASPLEIIEREFHAALSSEKAAAGISSAATSMGVTPTPATPSSEPLTRVHFYQEPSGGIIATAVQNLRSRSIKRRSNGSSMTDEAVTREVPTHVFEHVYTEPGGVTTFAAVPTITTTTVTIESDETDDVVVEKSQLRRTQSMSTNTPPLICKSADTRRTEIQTDINSKEESKSANIEQIPIKPPRKKSSRSTSPCGQYDVLRRDITERMEITGTGHIGEKKRDAGGPNEIVACTTCGGNSGSPCTHSANNGCATETCFVQVRKKEPPHPIRIAKTIDVIARITFPTAYAIFLIFFFVHYKGFS